MRSQMCCKKIKNLLLKSQITPIYSNSRNANLYATLYLRSVSNVAYYECDNKIVGHPLPVALPRSLAVLHFSEL